MPDSEKFVEGVAKDKIQSRIDHYTEILSSETIDKSSAEYVYAQDVIEEITNLLKKAEEGRSFVNSIDIQNRIEEYFKELEYIDKGYLDSKKEELDKKVGDSSSIGDEEQLPTVDELLAEIERIQKMEVIPPALHEIEAWKSNRPKAKSELEEEIEAVDRAIAALENRDVSDLEIQRRVTKNRIQELQEIGQEKQLFKVTDKGEIIIEYPEIKPELDVEAAQKEYAERRQDMLDKFYGNKEKAKQYSVAMSRLKGHEKEREFEYKDEEGKTHKGKYTMVMPYPGIEEDLHFLQLEEYPERLERLTKYKAGDKSAYNDVKVRTGLDKETGKVTYETLDPEEARQADEQYVETNNNAYNRLAMTRKNLTTLGKYGEKIPYHEFQKGQPVRNVLRAVGNAGRFVRNHSTAVVNKFVGSKIVAPIYGKITGADHKYKGLYSSNATHRYVARREYFAAQGKGFFGSRLSSIFKYKEGNKAVLSAGAYDEYDSIKQKYVQMAQKEAFEKKAEFAAKDISGKIEMIKADMEKAPDEAAKAKLQETLKMLEKAGEQILSDRLANQRLGVAQATQSDAIDITQHDKANKENVTRTVTVIKGAMRLGFVKFVGPKIKDWLIAHKQTTKTTTINPTQDEIVNELGIKVDDQRFVPTTYRNEEIPAITETRLNTEATMSEVMSSNAGKQVEGFYSVYGGERRPATYTLTGDEKVTAIFESVGKGGKGFSDTAGLKAPTLTDGTFAGELLEANGILSQNTTLEQMLGALQNGSITPEELSNVYVSIGDRYWTKLSELVKGVTKDVVVKDATTVPVVDVLEHYEKLSESEIAEATRRAVLEALRDPENQAKVQGLVKTVTETVPNERVIRVLDRLGMANKGFSAAMAGNYVYENLRHTDSDYEPSESKEMFEAKVGFKGTRKEDMKKEKPSKDREER